MYFSTSVCKGIYHEKVGRNIRQETSNGFFALSEFFDCNDQYVVQVVTCAIYGYLLRKRDASEAVKIADLILQYFYQNHKAPQDILVRQWTMLTLALADELSGTNTHFGFIKPPFDSENPYDLVIDKVENISDKYFGESKGSCKMYETLYGFSDFRRYIIGTNNRENSDVFLKKKIVAFKECFFLI